MKLQRSEKRLIVALICAFALVGVGYAGVKAYQNNQIQQALKLEEREQKQVDRTFHIGDKIVLDSKEDEKPLPSGGDYAASFSWDGRMDLTVDRARLYPDLDSVLTVLDPHEMWTIDFERTARRRMEQFNEHPAYVLLDVTLDNISAQPTGTSQTGYPWFSISVLKLNTQGHDSEMSFFNGMPPQGDINLDMFRFDLEPGSTGTYRVLFDVPQGVSPEDMFAYVGAGYLPNKYRIDVSDMEVMKE